MTGAPAKVALVTGAGSGIGTAVTDLFLAAGTTVVAVDLGFGDDVQAQAAGTDALQLISGDIRDPDTYGRAIEAVRQRFSHLDVAVFNAGVTGLDGTPDGIDAGLLEDLLAVNVTAVATGMQAVLPVLQQPGGSVVVTASVSGLAGDPQMWPYNASKAAVINMVRSWSLDCARRGIRVNAVCPGPIRTAMTEVLHSGPGKEVGDALLRNVPLGRWGTPTEVAAAIEFLASDAASFITGTTLVVDGGILAGTGQFPAPQ